MKKNYIIALTLISGLAIAQKSGIVVANMDKSVNPANDFYSYANGTWQKTFKLPESDARYGSFNEIDQNNLKKIRVIYTEVLKNTSIQPNTNLQKLRDFYATAMDSMKREKLGLTPIKPELEKIEKVRGVEDIMTLKAQFDKIGVKLFFEAGVSVDPKNSKRNIYGISQAGYGLGDRDFYYNPQFDKIRTEYINYLSELLKQIGFPADNSSRRAREVFDFETKLTNKALTRLQMRDFEKMYNIYSLETLYEISKLDWKRYFKEISLDIPDTMLVASPEYIKNLNDLIYNTPVDLIKDYARCQLLMEAAPFLDTKFEKIHFNFRGIVLSGAKKMKPRWEKTHQVINGVMGEIIGEEFTKRHFNAQAKVKLNKLIDNLLIAYRERIKTRDWMSDETKKEAYRKLDLLIRKVGYPDKWKDYSTLSISTESYWDNVRRASNFHFTNNLADLKKPADKMKWQMSPVTVNAYYDPSINEIVFPAAILQPPFFDPNAEDAANYGTMGAIIGHELTHGFDDQGAQFDADGNLKMWWTKEDLEKFNSKKQLIIDQFNAFIAIDTLRVNGSMTQGENIADLGGLTMSYNAYINSLNGKPSKVMDGFTGEQRFFIAWAQGWKSQCRDSELKRLLTVDYHSPAYFRAFAPLVNLPAFYKAFNVKPGDKMFAPENKRVEIW
ncbi:MAG: M13 family metallopeptidase [Bacteroidota bacterium]